MVKHTPAPWYAITETPVDFHIRAGAENGCRIAAAYGFAPRDDEAMAEALANLRLIAAAPELLAALKTAEASIAYAVDALQAPPKCQMREELDALRAVIAKAEGNT